MTNLTFWLLVLGIPLLLVFGLLAFAKANDYLDRHPAASWAFQFFVAAYFVIAGLIGLLDTPRRLVSAYILIPAGILFGLAAYIRFRSREKVGGGS